MTTTTEHPEATEYARKSMDGFHPGIIDEVKSAINSHDVVVVGMAWNPHVIYLRKYLSDNDTPFHYLEYGNYLKLWRKRLAIKIWSGWPTFPQVFVKGKLLGGRGQTVKAIETGMFKELLN